MLDGGSVVMETHKYRGIDKKGNSPPPPPFTTIPNTNTLLWPWWQLTGLLTGAAGCISQLTEKTSSANRLQQQHFAVTHIAAVLLPPLPLRTRVDRLQCFKTCLFNQLRLHDISGAVRNTPNEATLHWGQRWPSSQHFNCFYFFPHLIPFMFIFFAHEHFEARGVPNLHQNQHLHQKLSTLCNPPVNKTNPDNERWPKD